MSRRISGLLFAGAIAGLVFANVHLALRAYQGFDPTETKNANPQQGWRLPSETPVGGGKGAPRDVYVQTIARPLFEKTRRPFVMPKVEPPAPVQQPVARKAPEPLLPQPDLSLTGVATMEGSRRALLVFKASPKGKWLSVGDTVEGWQIVDIAKQEVVLANSGRQMRVPLYGQLPATSE